MWMDDVNAWGDVGSVYLASSGRVIGLLMVFSNGQHEFRVFYTKWKAQSVVHLLSDKYIHLVIMILLTVYVRLDVSLETQLLDQNENHDWTHQNRKRKISAWTACVWTVCQAQQLCNMILPCHWACLNTEKYFIIYSCRFVCFFKFIIFFFFFYLPVIATYILGLWQILQGNAARLPAFTHRLGFLLTPQINLK